MTADQVECKLAAILSADVKGYGRLMGEDEEWTLRTLDAYKERSNGGPHSTTSGTDRGYCRR